MSSLLKNMSNEIIKDICDHNYKNIKFSSTINDNSCFECDVNNILFQNRDETSLEKLIISNNDFHFYYQCYNINTYQKTILDFVIIYCFYVDKSKQYIKLYK